MKIINYTLKDLFLVQEDNGDISIYQNPLKCEFVLLRRMKQVKLKLVDEEIEA